MNDSPTRQARSTHRPQRPTPPSVPNLRRRRDSERPAADGNSASILEIHDTSSVRVSLEWLAREAELAQYELAAPTVPSAS